MFRLYFTASILILSVLFEHARGKCSTSNSLGCEKGCATLDTSTSAYFNGDGKKILQQHNNLRRRLGVFDLKWSARLEYMAYITTIKSECSHAGTNEHKEDIIEQGQWLQCKSYWGGHGENLHFPKYKGQANCYDDQSCVQDWIDEGPGSGYAHGHYNNMVSKEYKWVGCWDREGCLKCLYWGA